MCELTHCGQNYTGVTLAFNMKKFPSLEIFYTHAVAGVADKYQVIVSSKKIFRAFNLVSNFF